MSERLLQLKVVLSAVDRVVRPIRTVGLEAKTTAREVKAIRDRLKDLNAAQGQVDALRKLQAEATGTATALRNAEAVAGALRQQFEASANPTRAMGVQMKAAERAADRLRTTHASQTQELLRLRGAMNAAGVRGLSDHERSLKTQTDAATAALRRQEAALSAVNKRAQQMHAAKANYGRTMQTRNTVAAAGAGMSVAGGALAAPILKLVRDYSSFEDAMAGVARQVDGARDANGQLTATYTQIAAGIENLAANKIPLATTEIAALVEAGARMGIKGKDNLLAFAETAGVSAAAFDMAADEIGESLGKIANLYKIPIENVSELGDAINWLDDNAQSKGGDIIEVLQRMGGVADKLDYKKAAALGSTFLSLGASAEVAASASNAMVRELAIAQMQPKKFQAGLQALKLSAKDVQAGMAKDATGTILKVLDAIKLLPATQQLTVTTQLFGKEYGDDAGKLANNLAEYRRQLDLVNGEQAKGSMQREAEIKNSLLSAKWQMTQNKLYAQTAELGHTLRPTLVSVMEAVGGIVTATTTWSKEHPALTGAIVKGVAALALLLTLMGALTLGLAALIGPFAVLQLGMSMFGNQSLGLLGMLRGLVTGGLGLLTGALQSAWALLASNPIGWVVIAVAALAAGAYLLYRNWDTVRDFFGGLWAEVRGAFSGGISGVTALLINWSPLGILYRVFAGVLRYLGFDVPAKFTQFGGMLLAGLANGITSSLGAVKTAIGGAADSVVGWFKDKLGIHSPSRVFAELGAFTMAGLDQGLAGAQNEPLATVTRLAGRLTAAGAGIVLGATSMPVLSADTGIDRRPPLAATARAADTQAAGGDHYEIHLHPTPGMDEQDLMRMLSNKLDEIERAKAARRRSRLTDQD